MERPLERLAPVTEVRDLGVIQRVHEVEEKRLDLTALETVGPASRGRWAAQIVAAVSYAGVFVAVYAAAALSAPSSTTLLVPLPWIAVGLAVLATRVDRPGRDLWDDVADVSRGALAGLLFVPTAIAAGWLALLGVVSMTAAIGAVFAGSLVRRFRRAHPRRVILIGSDSDLDILNEELGAGNGFAVVAALDAKEDLRSGRLRTLRDVFTVARAASAEALIVGADAWTTDELIREFCRGQDPHVAVLFTRGSVGAARGVTTPAIEVAGVPLYRNVLTPTVRSSWFFKRTADVVLSFGLLVIAAPLMALIAFGVRRSSPGPILFRQERLGLDQRPFEILKFRTMTVNDDSDTKWSVESDPRVTRLGAFLRKSHLDELPQLANVLRGDMSLIGPRPERPYFVDRFVDEVPDYDRRFDVPQGITGWSQIHGLWGDTSIDARARFDRQYVDRWSLARDFAILLGTIPTLFRSRRD